MLSAYFDGELPPAEAARVERLIADDPAWATALAELQSLDVALDAYECPAMPRELPSRIVAARRAERSVWVRVLRLAAPLAAAAVIVLAMTLAGPWRNSHTATPPLAMTEVDDLASSQLLFFSNMDSIQTLADNETLLDVDTLDALAKLEAPGSGR